MKVLVSLFVLLTASTFVLGQSVVSYGMTNDENLVWLAKLKNADKELRWSLVKDRLIEKRQILDSNGRFAVPVLVINGIPVADSINERQKEFLVTQLTPEAVDIQIIDKEPEGFYTNKAFNGIVLMTIANKKAGKKFRKLW